MFPTRKGTKKQGRWIDPSRGEVHEPNFGNGICCRGGEAAQLDTNAGGRGTCQKRERRKGGVGQKSSNRERGKRIAADSEEVESAKRNGCFVKGVKGGKLPKKRKKTERSGRCVEKKAWTRSGRCAFCQGDERVSDTKTEAPAAAEAKENQLKGTAQQTRNRSPPVQKRARRIGLRKKGEDRRTSPKKPHKW